MTENAKIFVAGHNGMVGSSIIRQLTATGHGKDRIITRNRADLDLTNQADVRAFFEAELPDQVYLAAAKVGGIYANNTWPADFIYQNLMIEANVIDAAFRVGVKRLLFLGSSCIYPKLAPQPMQENVLLSGSLEPTNEPYAIAKIAGIKLCESYNRQYGASHGIDYRSVMPTNLYGPGDNYDPMGSHVVPALIGRFHEAKINRDSEIFIWGSGKQKREFLFVDDMASACIHVMNADKNAYDDCTEPMLSHINVGVGHDISIAELAQTIAKIVGYEGRISYDIDKPDGPPRKLIDSSLIQRLGWTPKINLVDGLQRAYKDFLTRQPA
ncbi:GDP-L-fucose synthase family protein [Candidatus Puniceispirillum marinum]|uniref:GDP-L-fucose synthase n=1 Tax=Puniceispirillum marinum (strain IMCC1322) TaxID=488538 RepID=D5BN10_PUNMI|nr:GDP-L-fucose synthase [Candidatus Puniceispirillum marinum]ADE40203.1 NAD-dependent epimerase/dehydratase [Candidatus Puniceispirillum marinum IMCC1322]